MAVLNGPGIITSGLISALDAADRNSYPGSGTTWTDISGNNNNGTLTNGPTFSSTNGGAIVLDGADDYINTGTINLQRNFSLEVIVNMDVTSGFCFFGQGTTTTNQGLHIWMISSGTVLRFGMYSNDYDIAWVPNTNTWYHLIFTYNNSTYEKKIFLNGTDYTGTNVSGPGPYQGSGQFNIGAIYGSAAAVADGKFAKATLYSKILSQGEISQNYNAFKTRFN